jgi:hypothetical protein
VQRECRL